MPSLTTGQFNFHTLSPCSLGSSPYWSYYLTTQHATWIRQDAPDDKFNDRSVGKFSYINIVLTPSSPSSFLSQILASQLLTVLCSRQPDSRSWWVSLSYCTPDFVINFLPRSMSLLFVNDFENHLTVSLVERGGCLNQSTMCNYVVAARNTLNDFLFGVI